MRNVFSKTNTTIATLQVNQLVFNYLSVAIRAFPIATYCHTWAKNGGFSAKKQRNTYCFRRKTLKKWRKDLQFRTFFVFLQPTGVLYVKKLSPLGWLN